MMTGSAPNINRFFISFLPGTNSLLLHEFRRAQSHQRSHTIRIQTNDDITRELIGVFPLVRRAGRDDEDIALRDGDILSPDGGCAGAALAVACADWPAFPIRDLASKLHVALAFNHVVNLRHVIVNGIVWILLT